jgi:hypothetical protein
VVFCALVALGFGSVRAQDDQVLAPWQDEPGVGGGRDPWAEFTPQPSSELEEIKRVFGMDAPREKTDYIAPTIKHTPIRYLEAYKDLTFRAEVTDNNPGVKVHLFYRISGKDTPYFDVPMEPMGDGKTYQCVLLGSVVQDHPLDYYIMAEDAYGNTAYTLVNINNPHRIAVRQYEARRGGLLVIALIIVVPTVIIILKRKYEEMTEARRAEELKRFIARQKELKRRSRKAFKRHMKSIQNVRRTAAAAPPVSMPAADLEEEEEELEPAAGYPPPGKASAGSARSDSAKIDNLLRKLDERLAARGEPEGSSLDLQREAQELLHDEELFGALSAEAPAPAPKPKRRSGDWERIDRTLEDLFGKGGAGGGKSEESTDTGLGFDA